MHTWMGQHFCCSYQLSACDYGWTVTLVMMHQYIPCFHRLILLQADGTVRRCQLFVAASEPAPTAPAPQRIHDRALYHLPPPGVP